MILIKTELNESNQNNLIKVDLKDQKGFQFLIMYFANAQSLRNKVDELACKLK